MAAYDDVIIIENPALNPKFPGEKTVALRNKNKNVGLVVNVAASSHSSFEVYDVLKRNEQLFPHEFEVRLPAGGTQYIGQSIIRKAVQVDPLKYDPVPVTYAVVGATYGANESTPLPDSSKAADYLRLYHLDYRSGAYVDAIIFSVNKNHVFVIDFEVQFYGQGVNHYTSVVLDPFANKINAQLEISKVAAINILDAKFRTFTPYQRL